MLHDEATPSLIGLDKKGPAGGEGGVRCSKGGCFRRTPSCLLEKGGGERGVQERWRRFLLAA